MTLKRLRKAEQISWQVYAADVKCDVTGIAQSHIERRQRSNYNSVYQCIKVSEASIPYSRWRPGMRLRSRMAVGTFEEIRPRTANNTWRSVSALSAPHMGLVGSKGRRPEIRREILAVFIHNLKGARPLSGDSSGAVATARRIPRVFVHNALFRKPSGEFQTVSRYSSIPDIQFSTAMATPFYRN